MAIYRGSGSASTTTDQATIDEVTAQATSAASSATSAASSASFAATSASQASTSATSANVFSNTAADHRTEAAGYKNEALAYRNSASTAAGLASTASTNASSYATRAETAETGAVDARAAAEGAQTAAEAAQALAEAAQSDASASAASASASASTATTKAGEALASASAASLSASESADSATQAAASAASAASAFDNFDDRYLGAKASDPALDNDDSTLIVGALYFNTTDGVMRIYTASGWINASSSSVATMQKYKFTATSGQTVFSGADDDAETLSITVGAELVTLNGIVLEVGTDYTVTSSSVTLTAGATTSDELNVYAFGNFLVADTVSASTGGTFQAEVTFDGGAAFNDNDKATFGTSDDLQIYHDGTNSYIDDSGTGDLYVRASDDLRLQVRNDTDTAWASSVICNDGGETSLHYNGTKKIATTNTGIDVTGTVTADGLTVDNGGSQPVTTLVTTGTGGGTQPTFKFQRNTDLLNDNAQVGIIQWQAGTASNNVAGIYVDHVGTSENAARMEFYTAEGGNFRERMLIDNNGDISFYEDTGTTAKFFWDASAESLGIGTTSPSRTLHINTSGYTGFKLQSSRTGSTENIGGVEWNTAGTDVAYIQALVDGTITFRNTSSLNERMRIDSSGNVGIGTASPAQALHLNTSGSDVLARFQSSAGYTDVGMDSGPFVINTTSSSGYRIRNSGTDAVMIDASGNLLVGTTTTDPNSTKGAQLSSSGRVLATVDGSNAGYFNRLTDDGEIIRLEKDGATVGSIGTRAGFLTIGTGDAGLLFDSTNNRIFPENITTPGATNGLIDLGTPSAKFKDLYLSDKIYLGPLGFYGATEPMHVAGVGTGSKYCYWAEADVSGGTGYAMRMYSTSNSSVVGSITFSTTATAYNTSSDYRLKENVVDMTGAIDRVKALNPSQFNFIADPDTIVDGFLAHEVADVVPEAVTGTKDAVDADGNPEYQGIDQSKLVPLLTGALQEAIARIETLEAEVATLKGN